VQRTGTLLHRLSLSAGASSFMVGKLVALQQRGSKKLIENIARNIIFTLFIKLMLCKSLKV
jgi:hypothetical protein